MMMNKTIPVETGCYIDGCRVSSTDFAIQVIDFAHDYGFELDYEQFRNDVADWNTASIFEDFAEIMDALDWTYEDALDYLNDNTRPGYVWVVRDQSLFLMTDGEADD